MWSNTRRGAQFLDGTLPKIARALERIANALENQVERDEEDITRRVLDRALELNGGRSIHIAEMIDELERKKEMAEETVALTMGPEEVATQLRVRHNDAWSSDWLEPYIRVIVGMIKRGEMRAEMRGGEMFFVYPEHK